MGHLAFSARKASAVYIPLVVLGWGGYAARRARAEPGFLGRVGLGRKSLRPAFREATLAAGASLAGMAAVGALRGTLARPTPARMLHLAPLLVLYPAWGLVQQALVQGLVAGNLRALGVRPALTTLASAATFGAVHAPSPGLAAGTFGMGLAFTPLFLRRGNVWPLGLYHGWLGTAYYGWVLGRSPWAGLRPSPSPQA